MTKESIKKLIDKTKPTKVQDYDDGRPDIYRLDLSKTELKTVLDVHADSVADARKVAFDTITANTSIISDEK